MLSYQVCTCIYHIQLLVLVDTARILKKFWAPGEPTSRTLTSEDRIGLSSLHGYLWNDEARYKSDAGGVSYKPICYCKNCGKNYDIHS